MKWEKLESRTVQAWETSPQWCYLYSKRFLLNSWETSKKLPLTVSGLGNVAGAVLLKLFSLIDNFLSIHK